MTAATADAFNDVLETSLRLSDLITAEVASLRAMRPRDIAPLQEEKAHLAARYDESLRRLRHDPESVKAVDPGRRDQLRRAIERLRGLVGENLRAIDAARTVNEKVLRTIAEAVARQRRPAQGYTAAGTDAAVRSDGDSRAVPLSLNERV